MEIASLHENNYKSLLKEIICQKAIVRRPMKLSSGNMTEYYIDCRQFYLDGYAQFLLGELFYEQMRTIERRSSNFMVVSGMAMGAIPLIIALSTKAFKEQRSLQGCVVRKEIKDHGTQSIIEGDLCLNKGLRVLIVEDVVTTGSSMINAINILRQHKVHIDTAMAIVDREQGGFENLSVIGVNLVSLFTLSDLMMA